ncbi:unnamed protein product [Paramecium pentaurelia]|uniref:Uncharacterized protein n=1 Tax=Paramecium pentaurelia TaxID=43138 RepID=A0A8S1W2C2_9CILI|nr:unnamed protein product [Paramecium pentaurelia]
MIQQFNLESNYQSLPDSIILQTISYEPDVKVVDSNNKQFLRPTVSKQCIHPKVCFEFETIVDKIQQEGYWQCEVCKTVCQQTDLCKDFRYQVNIEFNEFVTNVMIIEGKLFNKSSRKKRYLEHFTKMNIKTHLKNLYQRYVATESSINQIIIREQKNSQKINTGTNQRIQYWAFCLQDKVKITIPVRIIGCRHPECYELTSLIQLQVQGQEQFYVCVYPGCDNPKKRIDISTIDSLFNSLSIDEDLLQIIKKSSPSSMKFIFNYQTQKFEEDVFREKGRIIDPTINNFYQKNSKDINISFDEFQKQVQQQVAQICQNDLFVECPQLEKELSSYKFRNLEINMKDQLTDMIIEQPVRCKYCTNFSKCLDLKSYACEFIKKKLRKNTDKFKCPLCQTEFKVSLASCALSTNIYLDQNLLFRMFKDLSYIQTQKFSYLGQQYMIQEFQERQVLTKADYINSLKQKGSSLKIEFKTIFCSLNKNQKLSIPLLLQNCPNKLVIDFQTLYQQMEQCNFKLDNGLILCKCSSCNTNPIKKLAGQIFYHEAFDYALKKFYQSKSNQISFSFDFMNDNLTQSQAVADSSALQNITTPQRMGFLDMLNDEDYQNIFGKKLLEGRTFQILNITENLFDGIDVKFNQEGVQNNLQEKKDSMNQIFKNDQTLSKFKFEIKGIQLQLNDNPILSNLDFQA